MQKEQHLQEIKRHNSVRRVLLLTLVANMFVAAVKITIGLIVQSLAMVSDGVHSSLDATSNIIGLASTVIANRPPDATHPYGHRRFETLASMLIGGMLLLTAWEIIKNSAHRLLEGAETIVTPLAFGVMIGTLLINLVVSTYEKREGERLQSQILLADSEHTRSDIYVSLTVIGSLIAVWIGWTWIDSLAAIFIVILIGRAAWRIISQSVDVLVDRAVLEANTVTRIVERIPGVLSVSRVRSRGSLDDIHLDLDVRVDAATTTEHSNTIAREIRSFLRKEFDGLADIQVYFIPTRDTNTDYTLDIRAEADALGLGVHEIISSTNHHGLLLDMHVEVSPEQSVSEAHALVSQFEERLHRRIPELKRVVTHIEPAHLHKDLPLVSQSAHDLGRKALVIAVNLYPDNNWHDLQIRPDGNGNFAISVHCHVDPLMSLEDAHQLAENVETAVRADLQNITRVTIHTEPPE